MRILYLDPIGGIAGDMLVAALLDLGADIPLLKKQLAALPLAHPFPEISTTVKNGFAGKQISFSAEENPPCRHLKEITALISSADFPKKAEVLALDTFRMLAAAEAKAHGIDVAEVHFHEIGATDTILDICSVALLIDQLKIDSVISAPLPMGQGFIRCAHGTVPIPAPALNELLKGCTVTGSEVRGETLTPTGVALLKAMNCTFAPFPAMNITAVGCGAGEKDFPIPNLLRAYLGEEESTPSDIIKLECTVDDMTGEELGYLWTVLEAVPVNDLQMTPIMMKKGRPAIRLTVLVEPEHALEAEKTLYFHTSTIGMLRQKIGRSVMNRKTETVMTPYGKVHYKVSEKYGFRKVKPEADDLQKIAAAGKMSVNSAGSYCNTLFEQSRGNDD